MSGLNGLSQTHFKAKKDSFILVEQLIERR